MLMGINLHYIWMQKLEHTIQQQPAEIKLITIKSPTIAKIEYINKSIALFHNIMLRIYKDTKLDWISTASLIHFLQLVQPWTIIPQLHIANEPNYNHLNGAIFLQHRLSLMSQNTKILAWKAKTMQISIPILIIQ